MLKTKAIVEQGEIQTITADALVVNLFKGVTEPGGATGAVNRALDGAISEVIASGDLTGALGETVLLYTRGAIPAPRVIVVGLGERESFDLETVREASAVAIKRAQSVGAVNVATIVHGAGIGRLAIGAATQAVVEGSLLAMYRYREATDDKPLVETLTIVEFEASKVEAVKQRTQEGQIIAESVALARDLVNQPSNQLTPTTLAESTHHMSIEVGLVCRTLDKAEMEAQGMGALLAVAKGATEPPKFITMEHRPPEADAQAKPLILVGKGITFDTGGYSLKTASGMLPMKGDMGGAAAVIGTMRAIALLKLPLHVIGLVPATENVVSGSAYKPGEVFTAKNGVTIEIISTDAEGRLALADALCYADTRNPALVIDVATLTGGKVVAVGQRMNGLFCDDSSLREGLLNAGQMTGEPLWPLPLDAAYDRQLKSTVADIKNSGGRAASAVTAARFLNRFVGEWAWAHIDIAGSEFYDNSPEQTPRSYLVKGATGNPVRTLVEFLRHYGL